MSSRQRAGQPVERPPDGGLPFGAQDFVLECGAALVSALTISSVSGQSLSSRPNR